MFCQQDRAILCNDCDASIHAVNEHTRKHDRFLLTGVKLSAKSCVYKSPAISLTGGAFDLVPDFKSHPSCASTAKIGLCGDSQLNSDSDLTSSVCISEYLMETLPGWCVEDLLDSSLVPYGFSKVFRHPCTFFISVCYLPQPRKMTDTINCSSL